MNCETVEMGGVTVVEMLVEQEDTGGDVGETNVALV